MAVAPPTAWWCGCNRPPSAVMAFTLAQADGGGLGYGCGAWLMVWGQPRSTPGRAGDMVVTVDNKERSRASARSLKTIVDCAVGGAARAVAVVVVVGVVGCVAGLLSIPAIDRDEARFAQATKQMVESGEYVDIRFQDEVRYKKPVGIYWLQAGVVKTASALGLPHALTTIWLYRIPSLIGATAAVLLTYWAALAFVSRRAAVLAGLMMASCVLLGVERLIAKTDAMLLMTVVAAMGAMARAYLRPGRERLDASSAWTTAAVFWTALAAGVLLKGPLIVMVVGLAAVALIVVDRSARWVLSLKPLAGIVWLAILVLPWFLSIIVRAGEAFFAESVGGDLFGKVLASQESHGAPPGYYFILFWVTFCPGATLAALATPAGWRPRAETPIKFLLSLLLPPLPGVGVVVTKLPPYVLPLHSPNPIPLPGVGR